MDGVHHAQVSSKFVILPFGSLFVGCMDGLLNSNFETQSPNIWALATLCCQRFCPTPKGGLAESSCWVEAPSLEISQLPFSKKLLPAWNRPTRHSWGRSPTCQTWAFHNKIIIGYDASLSKWAILIHKGKTCKVQPWFIIGLEIT